ncbi:helix-turn-helix domain-containing protein [Colwellia sp. RE-S-Sl-9]
MENIKTWQQQHADFNLRLTNLGVTPSISMSDPNGMLQIAHGQFDAFEGNFEASPRLMLNLCTGGVAKLGRFSDEANLEGIIRAGDALIALPHSKATGYYSTISMLGIAVDLPLFEKVVGEKIAVNDLLPAASEFHRNPLITSVMTALWRDAEMNGLTSAFFEQGLLVIFNQLVNYRKKVVLSRPVSPLSGNRLKRSLEFIDNKLDSNLRVANLAKEVNLDVRTFTRTFRAATGYAPFEYLTMRRMEVAKELLGKGYTVTEISMAVGYSNPSKFSAAFRRLNGKSPTEWRVLFNLSSV